MMQRWFWWGASSVAAHSAVLSRWAAEHWRVVNLETDCKWATHTPPLLLLQAGQCALASHVSAASIRASRQWALLRTGSDRNHLFSGLERNRQCYFQSQYFIFKKTNLIKLTYNSAFWSQYKPLNDGGRHAIRLVEPERARWNLSF